MGGNGASEVIARSDSDTRSSFSEEILDVGHEGRYILRLGQVQVRTSDDRVLVGTASGIPRQDDDLDAVLVGKVAYTRADIEAIHPGHDHVENNELGPEDTKKKAGLETIPRRRNFEPILQREGTYEAHPDVVIIIDDEDAFDGSIVVACHGPSLP